MAFDLIGSMMNEANGVKRSKKNGNRKNNGRSQSNDFGIGNFFGGLQTEGIRKNTGIDIGGFGSIDNESPLSEFGNECVNCNDFLQQSNGNGFDPKELGGAFNGRFGQIGSGFIESVDSGKVGAIDFDKGAKAGQAISPVFVTGEGFGFKRGKLESIAEKESREIARENKKIAKEKMKLKKFKKAKKISLGSGKTFVVSGQTEVQRPKGERVIDVVRRKIQERKLAKQNERRNTFTSTNVNLGRGTGAEFETFDEGDSR